MCRTQGCPQAWGSFPMAEPVLDGTLFLHLPAHCFQPPQSSAPLLPQGPLRVHRTLGSRGLREAPAQLLKLLHHKVSHTGNNHVCLGKNLAPGPTPLLCSAQKPLDPELGDPSVAEQIPFTLGHWVEVSEEAYPAQPPPHPIEAKTPLCPRGWPCLGLEVQSSSPAYHCYLSLEDTGNHQPFARLEIRLYCGLGRAQEQSAEGTQQRSGWSGLVSQATGGA